MMKGAKEYAKLFKSGQYGKLHIVSSAHARGSTFHIYIGYKGEMAEVYGIIGGNPGWSESYGWLHKGKWVEDFERLVEVRRSGRDKEERERFIADQLKAFEKAQRIKNVLEAY